MVFDDKLWVIGGQGRIDDNINDIWYSSDGMSWTETTTNFNFSDRYRHTSVVFNDKLWVIAGNLGFDDYTNDVWAFE